MAKCIPTCRVCMQKSHEFVDFDMPLQNENEEDTNISYLDFFFECTRIEVEPYEGESQCFCLPCGDELRSFYKFVKIAEMTDRVLKSNRLVKGKYSRKSDSTFEIAALEPESLDNFTQEGELLNESVEGGLTDNVNSQRINQSLDPKGLPYMKSTVAPQVLVDLRVEIFQDTKSAVENHFNNELSIKANGSSKKKNKNGTQVTTYKKGPVECAFCHEILKNRKRLDNHLIEEHGRRTQPCEICGKMVIRIREHLLIHYREKNDISRPKIECPICLRKVSKQTISRHIRYVHKREVRRQTCSQCLQTFADAHKLKVHMAKGHTSAGYHKCPLCSGQFSNTISLNNHLRSHSCLERKSQEKVFSCNKCPMIFIARKLLDCHRKVHTDGQNFSG